MRDLRAAGVGWVRSLSPAAIVVAVQQKEFAIAAEASLVSDKPAGMLEAGSALEEGMRKCKQKLSEIGKLRGTRRSPD